MREYPLLALTVPPGWVVEYNDLSIADPDDASAPDELFREDLFQAAREFPVARVVDVGWYGNRESGMFTVQCVEPDFTGVVLEIVRARSIEAVARELVRILQAASFDVYAANNSLRGDGTERELGR